MNDSSVKTNQPVIISGGSAVQPVRGKMAAGYPVWRNDVVTKDSIDGKIVYRLIWKDKLRVIYTKDPSGKAYLLRKVIMMGNLPKGVYSELEIISQPAVLDKNGSLYNPLSVQFSGYWAYYKMGNMLPIDYRPERGERE